MGFAATEEAADPHRFLLFPLQPIKVGSENPLQSSSVLAIADKGFQLEAERLDLSLVPADFGHFRDAVVEQLEGRGIAEVQFAIDHRPTHGLMKPSVAVIGTAI